jgi:hypothetical protein
MTTKNNILISVVILLAVAAGGFWLVQKGPKPEPPKVEEGDSSWLTTTSGGVTFKYPETLGAEYIGSPDWPPQVQVIAGPFECTNAGEENEPAGKTETKIINGHEYCVTSYSEGAAGSVYTLYAYAYQQGNQTLYFTFSTQAPQCANFDEPRKSVCEEERQKFNIDLIIDRIVQSATVKT